MDKINIEGLTFHAKHGCHPEERIIGGTYRVNVIMHVDFAQAAETDQLDHAADYVLAMDTIKRVMDVPSNLIEKVCVNIAKELLKCLSIVQVVDVEVRKYTLPVDHELEYVSASTSLQRRG